MTGGVGKGLQICHHTLGLEGVHATPKAATPHVNGRAMGDLVAGKPSRLTAVLPESAPFRACLDAEPSLEEIAERTLAHYEANATQFWHGTRDHDVTQNYEALLGALGFRDSLRILDFGCGPGRDLVALRALGHQVTGLDATPAFVRMARVNSGCVVLEQSFFELDLGVGAYDGVFANASLFHVPRALLAKVLGQLGQSLVPGGGLFCSNPRSFDRDWEGFQGERYGSYLTIECWCGLIAAAGFVIERQFLRPSDKPLTEQPWLALVARRPAR